MIKAEKKNLLVLCGRNKRRSRTAEHIYKNDNRFNIRSAGLSRQSERKLNQEDLRWADLVLVINDEYEFMDNELVEILRINIETLIE